jgi:hypothetical protein
MQGRLSGGRLGSWSEKGDKESINPLASLANLADVMLVFACGLMLALIVNWNVDVAPSSSGVDDMYEIDQVIENPDENISDDLEEVGKVFKDPETGKWYFKNES